MFAPMRDLSAQPRPDLRRHQVSQQSGRQRRRHSADPALRMLPGRQSVERAEDRRDRRARLDSADRRLGPDRPVLRRCAPDRRLQHRLGPVPAEGAGQLTRSSTPASASAGRTSAGRSSCGRRTCSTRIMRRSRSTRRSRRAARRRRRSRRASLRAVRRSAIPGGRQIFSAFLAEPRTYGADAARQVRSEPRRRRRPPSRLRRRRRRRRRRRPAPDGSVILATDACPVPPPPPPPPPPARARLTRPIMQREGLAGNGGALS